MMQFNDKFATIDSYHALVEAYQVTFDDGSSQFIPTAKLQEVAAQPKQLAKGTKVKVHGIQEPSMKQFNDKLGTIHSYHVPFKAYQVTFDDGSSLAYPRGELAGDGCTTKTTR